MPYHDKECLDLILKFGKELKPDKLFILGDYIDMYSISKFDRNPARVTNLQTEFDMGKDTLHKLLSEIKPAQVIFTEGNHEDRLRKFIWNNPVLDGCIDIKEKLGINELGIEYLEYGKNYVYKDKLIYTHGNKTNKFSAYTAKNMLDDLGMSVILGHTHKLGTHYRTDYSGAKVAVENGCLCQSDLALEWFRREVIDWQKGITVIKWHDDRFNIHQICIPKDKFIIYGKHYYTLD